MHPVMRDRLEKALAGTPDEVVRKHLSECAECSAEFDFMKEQSEALRLLRAPVEMEPRAGFYARVMERIEAEGVSIWELFFESVFGRRIAIASLALALLFGIYLYTAERPEDAMVASSDDPADVIPAPDLSTLPQVQSVGLGGAVTPDPDSVLVNLVTYREQ